MSVDRLYDDSQWYRDNNCNQTSYTLETTGLISLDPTNFANQQLANPHVQYADDGSWLIMSYGVNNVAANSVCDAIYVVRRNPNGSYCIPNGPALAYPPVARGYYTTTPCRLLDTRTTGKPLQPTATPLNVTAMCGIDGDAGSVVGNVAAVAPSADGFIRVSPGGATLQTSTLNYRAGVTRANNFVMPLSPNGDLDLLSSVANVDAVVDVGGYFVESCVNYLGVGAGIAKTPTATTQGGYRYFAIVPTGDRGTRTAWLAWAVSTDGINWSFVTAGGTLTSDPRLSLHLIARADQASYYYCGSPTATSPCPRFWHSAMVYNNYDGYFYVVLGYQSGSQAATSLRATWWRIKFDSGQPFGLGRAGGQYIVEKRCKSCMTPYVDVHGVIPNDDSWVIDAQELQGIGDNEAVDPMDLVQLYKQDGTCDSMLFVYAPVTGAFDLPTAVAYSKAPAVSGVCSNFSWSTPKRLTSTDLGKIFDNVRYKACPNGPGGNYMAVNQSGWQASGAPQLYGFTTASPNPCPPLSVQGLLMLQLKLDP